MLAALGVGWRPAFTRTCSRTAVCMRFQVPSLRHVRSSFHTVDQGGNACGKARALAASAIYREDGIDPFTHIGLRGCPPGLAGGMNGSRIAHSRSLISTSDNCFAASFYLFPLSPLGILFPFSLLLYFTIWHASLPSPSPGHFIGLALSLLPSQAFAHSLLHHEYRRVA